MNHKTTILPLAMAAAVALAACSGPKPEQLTSCTENPVAKEFLETASYPDGDYSESAMPGFDTLKTAFRKDQPSPITVRWNAPKTPLKDVRLVVSCGKKLADTLFCIPVDPGADSALVYNLVPGKECAFRVCGLDGKGKEVVLSRGTLQAEGPLRMIYTDALNNVRDLGGWKTADGKTIRYGLIFRGGQLNRQTPPSERDIDLFKRVLGIRNDVDLRWDSELDGGTPDDPSDDLYFTPLGEGVEYVHMPVNLYALGQADTTQWNNRFGTEVELTRGHFVVKTQIYERMYRGYTIESMNRNMLVWDASVTWKILKNKAKLTLEVDDILNNKDHKYYSQTAYQQTTSWSDFRHHYASLTFTYHLDAKQKE